MAPSANGDPFLWDVEAVVQDLCSPTASWAGVSKRPDPKELAAALRNHEIDGETLITYEDLQPYKELFEDLGIKKSSHKLVLLKHFRVLKSSSRKYREWKETYLRELEGPGIEAGSQDAADAAQENAGHATGAMSTFVNGHLGDANPESSSASATFALLGGPVVSDATVEPAKQKRRLVPELVSLVVSSGPVHIPTEADVLRSTIGHIAISQPVVPSRTNSSSGAYIGVDAWPNRQALKEKSDPGDLETNFVIIGSGLAPPGRRLQVSRTTRRYLVSQNKLLSSLRAGIAPYVDVESDDEVLPVFGESDDENDFDEETIQEMMEEEAERTENARLDPNLSTSEVERILEDCLNLFAEEWSSDKLPRLDRRAHQLWTGSRRHGTRSIQSDRSRKKLEELNKRLVKLRGGILLEQWPSDRGLKRQAACMQPTLEEIKYHEWLLKLLSNSREPPKPQSVHKRPQKTYPRHEVIESDEDGEALTSDSDDDLREFVEYDAPLEPTRRHNWAGSDFKSRPAGLAFIKEEPSIDDAIDLTMDDPEEPSPQPTRRPFVNLITPEKRASMRPTSPNVNEREVDAAMDNDAGNIPFNRPADIAMFTADSWAQRNDAKRLLIALFWSLDRFQRATIFQKIKALNPDDVWQTFISHALKIRYYPHDMDAEVPGQLLILSGFALFGLFLSYVDCKRLQTKKLRPISDATAEKALVARLQFAEFCHFIRDDIIPNFEEEIIQPSTPPRDSTAEKLFQDKEDSPGGSEPMDVDSDEAEEAFEAPPVKRKRHVIINKAAQDLREGDKRRLDEMNRRRAALRAKLMEDEAIPRDKSRLIINESKQDHQGLIYVSDDIGQRIKDHQIDGVRFMWNAIVMDASVRQGCLLAHTMGTGKTMQVITLLVAIAEAAASLDPTVSSQIPEDLRESRTLVLCPPGLVDNWLDELLKWAPEGVLGQFWKIDSQMDEDERVSAIQAWNTTPGVMVMGYSLFARMVLNEPDEEEVDVEVSEMLRESANIVVTDEAHYTKNPDSKNNQACSRVRAKGRIALTGSPLANNVLEYHALITWVAPNYLGPLREFNERFAQPIHDGLFADSTPYARKKAKKMLRVLGETVAPKVNRATIHSIENDLPPKVEFIIRTPITDLQRQLYNKYVESVTSTESTTAKIVFSYLEDLRLICNHPKCFFMKLQQIKSAAQSTSGVGKPRPGRELHGTPLPLSAVSEMLRLRTRYHVDDPDLSWKVKNLLDILQESRTCGDKILLFSHSIPTLDYLEALLRMLGRRVSRLDGQTGVRDRLGAVKDFNSKDISEGGQEIYLISTKAGGVGLNIVGANRVVIFDFKFNPVDEQQAMGRVYRLGQKKQVYIYRFITAGTFEEDLQNLAVFKTQLASRVVDNQNQKSSATRLFQIVHPISPPLEQPLLGFIGKDHILDKLIESVGHKGILSIAYGDSFEEEDDSQIFTEEENQEIADLIRMAKLKSADPEAYEQAWRKLLANGRDNAADVVASVSYPRIPGDRPRPPYGTNGASAVPQSTTAGHSGGSTSSTLLADTAEARRRDIEISRAANALSTEPTISGPRVQAQRASDQVRGLPSEPHARSVHFGPAPMPMTGANTSIGAHPESDPPGEQRVQVPTPADGIASAPDTDNAIILGESDKIPETLALFETRLMETLLRMDLSRLTGNKPFDPKVVSKALSMGISSVRSGKHYGFLPDKVHWRLLSKLVQRPRFAWGVVTGLLPTALLALAGEPELHKMADDLDQLSEEDFRTRVDKQMIRAKDPKHLATMLGRSNKEDPVKIQNPRAMEDMKVMRETADRRRQPRLPSWAKRAVEEGQHGGPM